MANHRTVIPFISGQDLLELITTEKDLKFHNKDTNKDISVVEDFYLDETGFIHNLINEDILTDCSELGCVDMKLYFKCDCKIKTQKTNDGYYDLTIVNHSFPNEYLTINGLNMNVVKSFSKRI